VNVAVTSFGGDFQRELGARSVPTSLELGIMPGKLRAIFQFAANLDTIEMHFRLGSSSASVKLRCAVDTQKVLRVVAG
jgi:hypothetical protein